jgi:hypothetical protein
VKIFNHISTPDIKNTRFKIIDKVDTGTDRKLKLLLTPDIVFGSTLTFSNTPETSYISIEHTITLAKGRIL